MSVYREPGAGPSVDDIKRSRCQHIHYRPVKWYERLGNRDVILVCLACGAKLVW